VFINTAQVRSSTGQDGELIYGWRLFWSEKLEGAGLGIVRQEARLPGWSWQQKGVGGKTWSHLQSEGHMECWILPYTEGALRSGD
jgi:hypothetical protein